MWVQIPLWACTGNVTSVKQYPPCVQAENAISLQYPNVTPTIDSIGNETVNFIWAVNDGNLAMWTFEWLEVPGITHYTLDNCYYWEDS
jgi:hypothetical protein